jgi:hypothetical protein
MALTFSPQSEEAIVKAIQASVQDAIEQAFAPIVQEAHEKLDAALKEKIALAALRVMSRYDIMRDGANLLITVRGAV